MEIQKLNYFISLAETLSFTKSAKDNHITQANMSRHISALENELGVTLFKRSSRNVELTAEGKEFYPHAQSILNNYNYAMEMVANIERNKKSLRIGLGPYEHALVQPVIDKFVKRNPNVLISCLQHDYTTLAELFCNGSVDLMFCINNCADAANCKDTITIYDGEWITLCSKDSPLLKIDTPKLADFNGHVFINLESRANERILNPAVSLGFKPSYSVQTNTLSTKITLTAAGVGISRVPMFLKKYIPDDVAVLDCTYPSIRRFLCAYVASEKQNDTLTEFIEIVKEIYLNN